MDFSQYGAEVRDLNEKHKECLAKSDKRSRRYLLQMLSSAKALDDAILTGYVYHQLAYVEYYAFGRYESFLKYLRLAAKVLMPIGGEELINVYNLIAIDATNKGMYDVAFRYFQMAQSISEEAGRPDFVAIMDESMGYALLQLEDYAMSLKFTRRSMSTLKKIKTHTHYHANLMTGYCNDCIACLHLGKMEAALDDYRKMRNIMERFEDTATPDMRFMTALIGTYIAVATKRFNEISLKLHEMIGYLSEVPQIVEYFEDFRRLSEWLFDCGEAQAVGDLISALEEMHIADSVINARRILADLKVEYYLATGNGRKLTAAYEEQDAVYVRMTAEQKDTYRYVQELIQLTEELQKERNQILKENEALSIRTRSDALTGLPNRYAMNRYMEDAFEYAYRNSTYLGVGCLDVDGLKSYNDTYGHLAGDEMLQKVGEVLRCIAEEVRGFYAARYGGDEFVILYEGMTDEEVRAIAMRVAAECPIRVTQGICNRRLVKEAKSWDFLAAADHALYEGKKHGRNAEEKVRFAPLRHGR